jgi:glycosyltransferase involved in cell wall biosynthesis
MRLSVVLPCYRTRRSVSHYSGTYGPWGGMSGRGREGNSGVHRLHLALESLSNQSLARPDYEVIVVDDGGTVDLVDVLRPYQGRLQVRLVRQDHLGMVHAINRGVAESTGPLVFIALDHAVLNHTCLEAHVALHATTAGPERLVACGRQLLLPHSALFQDITDFTVSSEDVANFGYRPGGEWIFRALDYIELQQQTITAADVRERFRKIELLAASTPEYDDIETVLRTELPGACSWLVMRFGNHSMGRTLWQAVEGLDAALDAHEAWYADLDLGYRLWQTGATFRLAEAAVAIDLFHGGAATVKAGKATGLGYMIAKHRTAAIALLPHYLDRIGLTISEYAVQAEAARDWFTFLDNGNATSRRS